MNSKNHSKATTTKKTFSRTTTVKKHINANAETIWNVLTNGKEYINWNSTITMFEGEIAKGNTIKLKSYLDEKRVFKLKVKEFVANSKLVWGDAMGKRTFLLEPSNEGTMFTMTETIGGPFFPLFAKMIPPFDEAFEKFANDLAVVAQK